MSALIELLYKFEVTFLVLNKDVIIMTGDIIGDVRVFEN